MTPCHHIYITYLLLFLSTAQALLSGCLFARFDEIICCHASCHQLHDVLVKNRSKVSIVFCAYSPVIVCCRSVEAWLHFCELCRPCVSICLVCRDAQSVCRHLLVSISCRDICDEFKSFFCHLGIFVDCQHLVRNVVSRAVVFSVFHRWIVEVTPCQVVCHFDLVIALSSLSDLDLVRQPGAAEDDCSFARSKFLILPCRIDVGCYVLGEVSLRCEIFDILCSLNYFLIFPGYFLDIAGLNLIGNSRISNESLHAILSKVTSKVISHERCHVCSVSGNRCNTGIL